jgi:LuxR family quorum-sensing transcriptional regulator LasR
MRSADSLERVRILLDEWSVERSIQHYALLLFSPPGNALALSIDTHPDGWLCGYLMRNLGDFDPAVQHAVSSQLPTLWMPHKYTVSECKDLLEHDRKFGLVGALIVPLRASHGRWGWMRFAYTLPLSIKHLVAIEGDAVAVSQYALAKALELTKSGGLVALTPRQIRCLELASDGHRGKGIARILSVTERTVKFHFAESFKKLRVRTRAEAITVARQHGIIA